MFGFNLMLGARKCYKKRVEGYIENKLNQSIVLRKEQQMIYLFGELGKIKG